MSLTPENEEKLVAGMLDRGLFNFSSDYYLASGRVSPYIYRDEGLLSDDLSLHARMNLTDQRNFRAFFIGQAAEQLPDFPELRYEHVLGVAQAATVSGLAAVIANTAGQSYLGERIDDPSKDAHSHKQITGGYRSLDRVLLADNALTLGGSLLATAKKAQKAGLSPVGAFVHLDRQEGGKQVVEDAGLALSSLTTISAVVRYGRATKKLTMKNADQIKRYHETVVASGGISELNEDLR